MSSKLNSTIRFAYLDDQAPNKKRFWEQTEAILGLLYSTHPIEMIEHEQAAAHMRQFHKEGKGGNGVIPVRYMKWLDLIYKEEGSLPFSGKQEVYREFFKRHPQFSYNS
jgi:hypothetical protein